MLYLFAKAAVDEPAQLLDVRDKSGLLVLQCEDVSIADFNVSYNGGSRSAYPYSHMGTASRCHESQVGTATQSGDWGDLGE